MASWDETSPMIKFEDSPAESFVSTPGEFYPSLFADDGAEHEDVHNIEPSEMLTPPTFVDEAAATSTPTPGSAATPSPGTPGTSDKKMVKKRKSWGQVLPEPKTNLPPRKRAKTEDEKEQRRVERVLRNRRAAQSSRERKRLEVEALERRNKQLEAALQNVTKTNQLLVKELSKFRRDSGLLARSSSPLDSLCSNAMTLSQQLFSSQDSHRKSLDEGSLVDDLISSQPSATVNPASLSPELAPIAENDVAGVEGGHMAETNTGNSSSDLTQRPAAMLCDLQCQQSENLYQSWLAFRTPAHPTLTFFLQLQMLLVVTSSTLLSVCQRPLMQIALSLKAGFSLPPTPSIMKTIIWLVTLPPSSKTHSTLPSSFTTRTVLTPQTRTSTTQASQRTRISASNSPTLRIKALQRILTCSPTLARPLMDATMEALRLVSERRDDRHESSSAGCPAGRDGAQEPQKWWNGAPLPSREVLLTLLWALRMEERGMVRRGLRQAESTSWSRAGPFSIGLRSESVATKRKLGDTERGGVDKRFRLT